MGFFGRLVKTKVKKNATSKTTTRQYASGKVTKNRSYKLGSYVVSVNESNGKRRMRRWK